MFFKGYLSNNVSFWVGLWIEWDIRKRFSVFLTWIGNDFLNVALFQLLICYDLQPGAENETFRVVRLGICTHFSFCSLIGLETLTSTDFG